MSITGHVWLLVCWCVCLQSSCFSQNDAAQTARDTTILPSPVSPDSLGRAARTSSFHQTKSPWLAVGLSAALPGAGQIYNEDYWKVPVIAGFAGYWIYEWVKLNNKYRDYRDLYNRSLVTLPPDGNTTLANIRDFYRDERDRFAWYLGALYFVNLVDAYVGAHLYDFNVTPDITSDGTVVPRLTATIRLKF